MYFVATVIILKEMTECSNKILKTSTYGWFFFKCFKQVSSLIKLTDRFSLSVIRRTKNMLIYIYLPSPSTSGKMRHKIEFKTENSWF